MSEVVYRITRSEFATTISQLLDGEGGRRASGRWHSLGSPVAYFAESRALGILERLAHLSIHPRDDDAKLVATELGIPDELLGTRMVRTISADELNRLDPSWRQPNNMTCLKIGVTWLADQQHYALRVPSVIVPEENNLVINCVHPIVQELIKKASFRIGPATLDPRIVDIIDARAIVRRR